MSHREPSESVKWLLSAIERLPSDEPVPLGTQGYNKYDTQKAHWLGWLDPNAGTGTYPRSERGARDARDVYNRIVEPKMLIWLATAAGLPREKVDAAIADAAAVTPLASKAAAVRRHLPWAMVESALRSKVGQSL